MKKYMAILAIIAMASVSCKKLSSSGVDAITPVDNTKGYVVVKCDNCQLQYGMPDQYKMISVSGTSAKAYFTYKAGYKLVAYITSLSASQKLSITVYNSTGDVLYTGSKEQGTAGYWETDTLIPGNQ